MARAALSVEAEATTSREAAAVYGAFIIFGLGSWSSINAIFVQSSFLVAELPEKWALSTWIAVALQVANLAVLLFLRPLLAKFVSFAVPSAALLLTATGASLGLALGGFRATAWIFGAQRSVGLLLLTFFAGIASCGSSLTFYPLAAAYPRRYTTALAIGEGLSGSCAGVLGMLQSFNVLPKSFAAAFAFSLALCLCALLALLFIDRHHAAAKLRSDGARSDGALMETPADVPSDLMGQLLHFRAGMLALFWGSALNFGLLPSLNPIACSGFSNAQEVLLWSNAVIYGFDPISRLLTAFTNFRHFWSLTALFTFAALLVVAVAKTKSLLGEWVVPAANVAFAAGFGYARTMAFLVLKDLDSLAPRLYAAAGAAVQAGSFFGTVVALLLVEVLKVF
ncbi:unnamed protein product [Effrenium voratum]|uniref:Uncharacterized protein n=1 Tax=Effrenium voratum TaxID=2562239 RepID=A0AA36I9P3_9DINO|nr:unnamed protein product [Effrenium voratum]CAJ1429193.1 unnamed protein product [Effrenium voratum]